MLDCCANIAILYAVEYGQTAPPPRRIGGFGLDSTARKTEAGSPQNAVNSSGIVTVTSDTTDDKTDEGTTKKFGRRAVGVPIESVASGAITTVFDITQTYLHNCHFVEF